jgi:hypothetical protein
VQIKALGSGSLASKRTLASLSSVVFLPRGVEQEQARAREGSFHSAHSKPVLKGLGKHPACDDGLFPSSNSSSLIQ